MADRCTCIHDPRVNGSEEWWLPQWWLPQCRACKSNPKLDVDVHIDWDGKYQFSLAHYGHPYGKCVDFATFESHSDSILQPSTTVAAADANGPVLNHIQRVQIAHAMRSDFSSSEYKYKYVPTHKIFCEMCMLLQTKAFDASSPSQVVEIPLPSYDQTNEMHILAREIAFGHSSNTEERPLAIWFNIPNDVIEECTEKERSRPKRTTKKLNTKKKTVGAIDLPSLPFNNGKITYAQATNQHRCVMTSFDDKSPYLDGPMKVYCPKDEACYNFTTSLLDYHANNVKSNQKEGELKGKYDAIKRHFSMFDWPINLGRDNIDKSTIIPKVQHHYAAPKNTKLFCGLWDGFVAAIAPCNEEEEKVDEETKRLDIFVQLSNGRNHTT
jgi:hypothetical protein